MEIGVMALTGYCVDRDIDDESPVREATRGKTEKPVRKRRGRPALSRSRRRGLLFFQESAHPFQAGAQDVGAVGIADAQRAFHVHGAAGGQRNAS